MTLKSIFGLKTFRSLQQNIQDMNDYSSSGTFIYSIMNADLDVYYCDFYYGQSK